MKDRTQELDVQERNKLADYAERNTAADVSKILRFQTLLTFWYDLKNGLPPKIAEISALGHCFTTLREDGAHRSGYSITTRMEAMIKYLDDFQRSPGSFSKGTCRGQFKGSKALFEACWRTLLKDVHATDINTQADADNWLEASATEKVNSPRSRFWKTG